VAKKVDRRVERTQKLLRGALRSLLEERGFETLTVQHIIDRANVGRATFYAHFDSKDDLLASGFEDLRASLRARQREALSRGGNVDDRVLAFSHDMFAHANEYREVFRGMVGKQSGAVIQRLLHKLLVDLVREDVTTATRRGPESTEALAQFIGGGLVALLIWWLNARVRLSVAEIDALFRRFAIPALKAATR
jgi:AcrR family transcriptional regulator